MPRTRRGCAASGARSTSCPCSPMTRRSCRSATSPRRPGCPRPRSCAWCTPWSRAGCCGPPPAATSPAPGCGAGPTWPGEAGSCRRRRRRLMRDLGARHQETVNLYVLRDICRVCVAQQESPRPLRHVVQVGDELPLWAGASSKILLSDAPDALLVRVARRSPGGESIWRRCGVGGRRPARRLRGQPRRTRGGPVRRRGAGHRPLRRCGGRAGAERPHPALYRRNGWQSSRPT